MENQDSRFRFPKDAETVERPAFEQAVRALLIPPAQPKKVHRPKVKAPRKK